MSLLDQKAESVDERLWLVSNTDGTQEIVAESERAGRGGFAPAWGQTYRQILASILGSMEASTQSWVEFAQSYAKGVTSTAAPLSGKSMPAVSFVAGNHTYTAYLGTNHKGGFLGFGGALAKITMTDGTVHESNNVWSGRDVPPKLRALLPNNATIRWES